MNQNKIKHLYARAGFGLSANEWKERRNWTVNHAINDLFAKAKTIKNLPIVEKVARDDQEKTPEQRNIIRKQERQLARQVSIDWLLRMSTPTESVLIEKMSLFWHGHFACRSVVGHLAYKQLNVIRKYGLGNFRDLVKAIAKDPSMIKYLDNKQNKKNKPNENFARELMELFTIGINNYSEKDVKEAARAFTGWSITKQGKYIFKERHHDFGKKVFMGQTGKFNGEEIIDIILENKKTAYFITTKIYRYFVNEQIDEKVIVDLAEDFYKSDYNIEQLMRTIFESDWFYDVKNIGTKIKSPSEFVAGMLRQLNGIPEKPEVFLKVQKALGQTLFNPPNVAGWPSGKNWIDNSTLMLRLSLPGSILHSSGVTFAVKPELEDSHKRRIKKLSISIDFQPILDLAEGLSKKEATDLLVDFFLHASLTIPKENIQKFVLKKESDPKFLKQLAGRLMSLPEYQLC